MGDVFGDKSGRILYLYSKLISGEAIDKPTEAVHLGVTEKTIQRHIDDIRRYLETGESQNTVIYNRAEGEYTLEHPADDKMNNGEILALCKILLESRAFPKAEMNSLLEKLLSCCVPKKNKRIVAELISNEAFHYVEPRHGQSCIENMWSLGQAIQKHQIVEIDYQRTKDGAIVRRKLRPVAILFSEYYFYLAAFIDDEEVKANFEVENDKFPTIYRLDRIKSLHVKQEKFQVPYASRFEEGEFRKRIQFMYGGRLHRIRFKYFGPDVDSILDRLPTARIVDKQSEWSLIEAEVFGKGIDMWIRAQGNFVQMLDDVDVQN